jgi:hypothetical protein
VAHEGLVISVVFGNAFPERCYTVQARQPWQTAPCAAGLEASRT